MISNPGKQKVIISKLMIENYLKVRISFCVKKSSFDDKKSKILTLMYGFTENGLR